MRFLSLLLIPLLAAMPATAQRADRATPGWVRVRMETADGPIVLALNQRRAPITTANFLRYVDDGRFDGVSFYRTARNRRAQNPHIRRLRRAAPRIRPPCTIDARSRRV